MSGYQETETRKQRFLPTPFNGNSKVFNCNWNTVWGEFLVCRSKLFWNPTS